MTEIHSNDIFSKKNIGLALPYIQCSLEIVIIPSDTQRAAIKAMQKVLETIKTDGDCSAMANEMASFKDREEIVNTAHFVEIDQRYAS